MIASSTQSVRRSARANRPRLRRRSIVALIALYGLANWFYGAFAAAGPALRRLTRLAWAFAIVLALAFALMYALHAEFRRGIEQEWQQRRGMVVQVDRAIEFALAQEAGHAR